MYGRARLPALLAAACGFNVSSLLAAADNTAVAQELLARASTPAGLCVHLGAGSAEQPSLTADLAASGAFLVHGLALDDAALERARQAIARQKLTGRAFVEHLALRRLPYLPDLANLLVAESPEAWRQQGITREEMLRVVTPGGVLCVREGGKWTFTTKPLPADLDEWSHVEHDAAGNNVSFDTRIAPPFGLRWLDGVQGYCGFSYLGSFGWIVAGGRCFTLGPTVEENVGKRPEDQRVFLLARDAWNGLPLWQINCGYMLPGDNRFNKNVPPLAADGKLVFAPFSNQVMAVEAATGRLVTRYATAYPGAHLVVTGNTVVIAGWADTRMKGDKWLPQANLGCVEAFDVATGQRLWSVPGAADKVVAAGRTAYLQILGPTNHPACSLAAVELATGKVLWRKSAQGDDGDWFVNTARPEGVIAYERRSKMLRLLDAQDGHALWELGVPVRYYAPAVGIFGDELWCGTSILDVKTGRKIKSMPSGLTLGEAGGGCADARLIDRRMIASGKGSYTVLGADGKAEFLVYTGVRRACGPGDVIAYGTMFIPQGRCMGCARGQVLGFRGVGSLGAWPTQPEMEAPRPIETGPAFGQGTDLVVGADAWPQFRHDAERSACTATPVPDTLQERWRQPLPGAGAPVSAHGMVFVPQPELGAVTALDADTGRETWRSMFGSRVQTPAIWRGLCLVACADGWLYALSVKDGRLSWRTRCAPEERRMTAFGRVESCWPIEGAPMVDGDRVYVSAGRTSQSDGGVAVLAIDAASGRTIWARQLCNLPNLVAFRNTWLAMAGNNALLLHLSTLALKDGAALTNASHGVWASVAGGNPAARLAWDGKRVLIGEGLFPLPQDGVDNWEALRKKPLWKRSEGLVPSARPLAVVALTPDAAVFAGTTPGKQANKGFVVVGAADTGARRLAIEVDAPVGAVALAGKRLFATTPSHLIGYAPP